MHQLTFACLICQVLLVAGCVAARPASSPDPTAGAPPRPARINHLAFFKLKDPADAPELIRDCDQHLATIPGVVAYYAGPHLDTARGARVESDYDVGFFVGFETEEDYAAYLEHPAHQAAVARWSPRWRWIRIYDVLDETP